MKAAPVMEVALGLVSVIVIVLTAPFRIVAGAKTLVAVGTLLLVTISWAVVGAPVPPFVEVMLPVLLLYGVAEVVGLCTLEETVQLPPGSSVAALIPSVVPAFTPPTLVAVEPELQVSVELDGVELTITPGVLG